MSGSRRPVNERSMISPYERRPGNRTLSAVNANCTTGEALAGQARRPYRTKETVSTTSALFRTLTQPSRSPWWPHSATSTLIRYHPVPPTGYHPSRLVRPSRDTDIEPGGALPVSMRAVEVPEDEVQSIHANNGVADDEPPPRLQHSGIACREPHGHDSSASPGAAA